MRLVAYGAVCLLEIVLAIAVLCSFYLLLAVSRSPGLDPTQHQPLMWDLLACMWPKMPLPDARREFTCILHIHGKLWSFRRHSFLHEPT